MDEISTCQLMYERILSMGFSTIGTLTKVKQVTDLLDLCVPEARRPHASHRDDKRDKAPV